MLGRYQSNVGIYLDTCFSSTRPSRCSALNLYYTICPHYSTLLNSASSQDWVVDSGASQHVTTDLATLALHEPYTTSDSVIISDGTSLSVANIGSFTLTSLPTPLLFNNVIHVPAMSKNLISVSALCANNPINALFF